MIEVRSTAWESTAGDDGAECPAFAKKIIYDDSDGSGKVELKIPAAYRTFAMTYCKSNHTPRIESSNLNTGPTAMAPDPILICSRDGGRDYAENAVKLLSNGLSEDLSTLSNADPEAFQRVVARMPMKDQELVRAYLTHDVRFRPAVAPGKTGQKDPQPRPVPPTPGPDFRSDPRPPDRHPPAWHGRNPLPRDMSRNLRNVDMATALATVMTNLRSNLRYFYTALTAFGSVLDRYPALRQYLVHSPELRVQPRR